MKSIFGRRRRVALALVLLFVGAGVVSAARDTASTRMPQPRAAKYFGEEFASAQRALADKPAAEMPQAF